MLIAQAVFLLERGQTGKQTRLNALPTPAAMPAWVISSILGLSTAIFAFFSSSGWYT